MKGTRAALFAAMLVTSAPNSEAPTGDPPNRCVSSVPSSAGGGTDMHRAHRRAPKLTQSLGQQIIVDDRRRRRGYAGRGEIVAKSGLRTVTRCFMCVSTL